MTDKILEDIVQEIIYKNWEIVEHQRERAVGPLMGIVMKELYGTNVSGEEVNKTLTKCINKYLGCMSSND